MALIDSDSIGLQFTVGVWGRGQAGICSHAVSVRPFRWLSQVNMCRFDYSEGLRRGVIGHSAEVPAAGTLETVMPPTGVGPPDCLASRPQKTVLSIASPVQGLREKK